ncbi:CobQ/CobB/MinD/ParA nucleotide binding domain protein [compost metagenome]|uniref:CobQ/CobB/MinD/ParA nucleotide binding domain-containing protein n=1 Tax=Paenibacillus rhizolycopersici TaxID=2780073 RepID=A0ABS2H1J5_9BACL|nr:MULTISPECIES: hypothetical protein [Paenibacillus]MBM6994436.1 hypothetical protein [Paenibacillus rhizolycopersici]GIP49595.1 hypothetical protein J53TS2_31860 [Paenibacillus sp. J53TS2]
MVPIKLVLAVQEEEYIDPFLRYVHASEFDRRLVVTAFSRKEAFAQYVLESGGDIDAILGDATFLEAVDPLKRPGLCCIQLGEDGNLTGANGLCIEKYQPLHQLLSSVVELVRGGFGTSMPSRGRPIVIGVYSTVGGCGKTTVALHLARQLATEGGKVFYLNLETIGSELTHAGQSLREGQAGLARLLYDLKAADDRREPPRFPISAYAYRHPVLQGDTLAPPDNLNELLEMERKDTSELLEYIAGSGLYDSVIVDMDSFPDGRTEAVLERADRVVWIVTDDWGVMRKTGGWLAHLERTRPDFYRSLLGKARFVLNRYTGKRSVDLPRPDLKIQATLSHIPAWSQGNRQGDLLYSPLYQRDMIRLCSELHGEGPITLALEG